MSKRSRSVSLALMSLAPVMLAACAPAPSSSSSSTSSKPRGPTAYETVEDCVFDGNKKAACQEGFKTAQAEALANAPRFATGEECALAFENCQPVETVVTTTPAAAAPADSQAPAQQHASSGFMPMMAGFMMGNALGSSSSGAGAGAVSAGFNGQRDAHRPAPASNSVLYRARGGQLSQVSNAANGKPTVSPVKARTVTSAQVARAKAASTQARSAASRSVSRSGFGGRSGGFGG